MSNFIQLEQFCGTFCIAKLPVGSAPEDALKPRSYAGNFRSVTITPDEVSIICEQLQVNLELLPDSVPIEKDWVLFRVCGTLDFELVGILSRICQSLAADEIPLFCLSTFDTDYVLVKSHRRQAAINAFSSYEIQVVQ